MWEKYIRQITLPEVGFVGQQQIFNAKVLIIGMGGLGCPAAMQLALAGVGTLGIMDFDKVELSNLHRQFLYTENDIGKLKVEVAKQKLAQLNATLMIQEYPQKLNNQLAVDIFSKYDIIIDGTDRIHLRYLINDACRILNKPWIYAGINAFNAQIAMFNYNNNGIDFRSLFPNPPSENSIQNCTENGVIGIVPNIIGAYQSWFAVQHILQLNATYNTLSTINFKNLMQTQYKIKPSPIEENIPLTISDFLLFDYPYFCHANE